MKLSGPGLLLCLFLLFVHAKAQIEFGPDPKPKRTRPRGETVEVETRLNANKKQGGLLADILGKILFHYSLSFFQLYTMKTNIN